MDCPICLKPTIGCLTEYIEQFRACFDCNYISKRKKVLYDNDYIGYENDEDD